MQKVLTLSTNDFQPVADVETGKYKATILAATLGFSGSRLFRISKLLKNDSGVYKNIILSYEINSNGDLIIYSDEIFTGRLIAETDS